jgi:transmembrane sensor
MTATDIEAAAAEWLVRIERDPSAKAAAALQAWLAADARHHAAFLRLENVWRQADRLRKLRPLDGTVDEKLLDSFAGSGFAASEPGLAAVSAAPCSRRRWVRAAALPAAIVLAIATVSIGGWLLAARSQWEIYRTGFGGFQRIPLPDGSTALLNTDSELRVRFTGKVRQIVLDRGEAAFTVAKDARRPFDVLAADTTVRATGTMFTVRLREQAQVDVLVAEGHVAIDPASEAPDINVLQSASLQLASVAVDEAASIQGRRLHLASIDALALTRRLAWTRGQLWFDRTTLADAVSEFNRYNRRQLVIADSAIAGIQIGGSFEVTDLNSFVAALQLIGVRAFPLTRIPADAPDAQTINLARAAEAVSRKLH